MLSAASSMLIQPDSTYDLSRLVSLLLRMLSMNLEEVSIGERLSKAGG